MAAVLATAQLVKAQDYYENQAGNFSLGLRSSLSCFFDGPSTGLGTGGGGHFRIQVIDRVNTEWFADVMTANIMNKAHRTDIHVGKGFKRKLTPYIVAGNCFDETIIKLNGKNGQQGRRFSSMIPAGIGCHYNITPVIDLTATVQYGLHLGNELDTEENEDGSLSIVEHKNAGWEGHLLVSISLNYKICKLWKNRK